MATKKTIGIGRHVSAIKRDQQSKITKVRNRHAISTMRTAIKKVRTDLNAEALNAAIPLIGKVSQKGMIHKNKASRLISRLTKAVNSAKNA